MLEHIVYTIILAFLFAMTEIQIEGSAGWARHLPTFRINVFWKKILGGKPLTGYHLFMILNFMAVFHAILHEREWSWQKEAEVFGLLSLFFVIEDYLWFVFNPHYGIKKFLPGKIEWHKRWFLFMPITYWFGILSATFLLYISLLQ